GIGALRRSPKSLCGRCPHHRVARRPCWSGGCPLRLPHHPARGGPPQGRRGPTIFPGGQTTVLPIERRARREKSFPPSPLRGRFAVPDPARPAPETTPVFHSTGGSNDLGTAYRRTARRASGRPR